MRCVREWTTCPELHNHSSGPGIVFAHRRPHYSDFKKVRKPIFLLDSPKLRPVQYSPWVNRETMDHEVM